MQFDEFLKVLDLLQNPDKFAAQIADLTKRHDEIKTATDNLNLRVNVAITQEQADQHLADAAQALADAKVQAQAALTAAQTAFDSRHAELSVREKAADQAMQAYNTSKLQWAQRQADHKAAQSAIDEGRKQLEADRLELRTKQAEVDMRLDKLRQAMG